MPSTSHAVYDRHFLTPIHPDFQLHPDHHRRWSEKGVPQEAPIVHPDLEHKNERAPKLSVVVQMLAKEVCPLALMRDSQLLGSWN
jgi:hypothetical protein